MLQRPVPPSSYSLRERKSNNPSFDPEDPEFQSPMADMYDDHDDPDDLELGAKGRSKSRRELPSGAVATLKAWLLSPEHFTHPYPTPQDQAMLMQKTGIDKKQLKNWFTNARRRIWKPMLKKQIEQGKLSATPGAVPGMMIPSMPGAPVVANGGMDNPHSIQAMRTHYQQAVGSTQQQQPQTVDANGNPIYGQPSEPPPGHPGQYYVTQTGAQPQQPQYDMTTSSSIGTLPQLLSNKSLNKTDSHAVLMELFARDQDLVRQATESARLKSDTLPQQAQQGSVSSQHPMKAPSQGSLANVPTMNSWPHFSSITSLNNLGTIPGVKSITSLSGADLASKGGVNKMGNLAQVKSMESMGKNDSYAFLEVFFGDRSSISLSGMAGARDQGKGMKQNPDEDNEIGLSLEDESPSQQPMKKEEFAAPAPVSAAPQPAPLVSIAQDSAMDNNTLKRAYDDALAARGLISVSRSSERLTDLALPAKMQRTLSQEYIRKPPEMLQQQEEARTDSGYGEYAYTSAAAAAPEPPSHQYPGQQPGEPQGSQAPPFDSSTVSAFTTDPSQTDGHVQVPSETKCALCSQTNVDTQLRPCGHMFHERCLKPSLQRPNGPPKCPCDDIPMESALLAIPTVGVAQPPLPESTQQQSWASSNSQPPVPAQNQGN